MEVWIHPDPFWDEIAEENPADDFYYFNNVVQGLE